MNMLLALWIFYQNCKWMGKKSFGNFQRILAESGEAYDFNFISPCSPSLVILTSYCLPVTSIVGCPVT